MGDDCSPQLLIFFFNLYPRIQLKSKRKWGKKAPYLLLFIVRVSKGRSISVAEVPRHSPLEGIQVVDRRKYRGRKAIPEFTSEREERLTVLVHSCIRGLDSK